MTPARFAALCSVLNLGETRIAEATGYTRGAVKNWGRGRSQVWPPLAVWLEAVAPQVQRILERHPMPNRLRPEAPAPAPAALAEVLRSLPPPLVEPREVRRAAIAAERAARQVAEPPAMVDHARPDRLTPAQREPPPRQAPEPPPMVDHVRPGMAPPAGPPVYCGRCGRTFRTARCVCEAAA